jgi:type II secretory pathway component PulC
MFSSNKPLLMVLFFLALSVWGFAAFRVVMALSFGSQEPEAEAASSSEDNIDFSLLNRKAIVFDSTVRNPFKPFLYAKRPAVKKRASNRSVSRRSVQTKKQVSPPDFILSGILGGASPVAILKKGGKTELAKKGAAVWGFTVVSVGKNSVVVSKDGSRFTIAQ